mgnify:CR=1 FL=1
MKKKVIIAYLCSPYEPKKNFGKFINYYRKYKAGVSHRLIICYKNLNIKEINYRRKKIKKIRHEEFIDPEKKNDFDFGTYKRIAERYKHNLLFFMNGHAYPLKKNWLRYYSSNYRPKRIIVSCASFESISSKSIYRHYLDNYFEFFYKIIKYHILFPVFPNPHFQTNNFLILGNDFLKYNFIKNLDSKEKAWRIESGKNSLYYFFKKRNFKILVVNSDNKLFSEKNWIESHTYAIGNQSKKIMSDNHVRKYSMMNKKQKLKKRFVVWGY